MALENWTRAVDNFKKCLEAADCLYGKSEPKCIEIAKHLQVYLIDIHHNFIISNSEVYTVCSFFSAYNCFHD